MSQTHRFRFLLNATENVNVLACRFCVGVMESELHFYVVLANVQ